MLRRVIDILQNRYYAKKGYSSYYVSFWRKEMKNSYKNSTLPKKQIKWAKKHGFKPFRIEQYGLNEENCNQIISDDDYFWLYPLNEEFAMKIVDDKLTMKFALSKFNDFLPQYYFQITNAGKVYRLMDCPQEFAPDNDGIIKLLKEKGKLAVKLTGGTYGKGFYKFEYANGNYYVNMELSDLEKLTKIVSGLKGYLVCEFIEMNPQLKKLYPDAVNTIRVMAINEHGDDPIIPFAFMRMGTSASKMVDNTAQGGMFCKVDVNTGRFYDGETCVNHVITKVDTHPDTNEKIEGILPNWELVKQKIIEIVKYIPGLRWAGFDIAITQDGFKIIEINSHQGLHRAHLFPKEVSGFLSREVEND